LRTATPLRTNGIKRVEAGNAQGVMNHRTQPDSFKKEGN